MTDSAKYTRSYAYKRRPEKTINDQAVTASDILDHWHPLNSLLKRFCGDNPITKRQASKFLQKYRSYSADLITIIPTEKTNEK